MSGSVDPFQSGYGAQLAERAREAGARAEEGTVPPGQVDYGPPYGVSSYPETTEPARAPAVAFLPRSICVEAQRRSLTVGELRRLLEKLPDEVEIRADSLPVKVAAHYGSLLLLDTSTGLPDACTGCGKHGCDGRCS